MIGKGAFYFCATLPGSAESSLLREGVSFYVMLHRALAAGADTRSKVGQFAAGTEAARAVSAWELLSEAPGDALSSDRSLFAGTFSNGDQLAALNRPAGEDSRERIDQEQVDVLLEGLPYRMVQDEIGSASALASEIWRLFVFLMAMALIVEAVLCLPERQGGYRGKKKKKNRRVVYVKMLFGSEPR